MKRSPPHLKKEVWEYFYGDNQKCVFEENVCSALKMDGNVLWVPKVTGTRIPESHLQQFVCILEITKINGDFWPTTIDCVPSSQAQSDVT